MKIFLDDVREAPDDSWYVVRTPHGCLNLLVAAEPNEITILSVDHDLASFTKKGEERTGYWVLCQLEELAFQYPEFRKKLPKQIVIHSANPVGRKNMQAAIDSIERIRNEMG